MIVSEMVLEVMEFQCEENLLSTAPKVADGCILPDAGRPKWKSHLGGEGSLSSLSRRLRPKVQKGEKL
jgi:hypothetical protein